MKRENRKMLKNLLLTNFLSSTKYQKNFCDISTLINKNQFFIHLYHKLKAGTSRLVEWGGGGVSELCRVIFTASLQKM
jgi:hypothetical protein